MPSASHTDRVQAFCAARKLVLGEPLAKGYSSQVYLVHDPAGKPFALKAERDKSTRRFMVEQEAACLALANTAGVGPKLVDFDKENRCLLLEFVEGPTFDKFLDAKPAPSPRVLRAAIDSLQAQAKTLDEIGVDHGQLAGRGRNILVRPDNTVCILDFEKASYVRKCHNASTVEAFLFRNVGSAVAKKVAEILK